MWSFAIRRLYRTLIGNRIRRIERHRLWVLQYRLACCAIWASAELLVLWSFHSYYFAPRRDAKYCDQYVCVCVCGCLSVCISGKPYGRTLPIFKVLLMAVARFSSYGVAIRYVFPVLLMTSYFHIMRTKARRRVEDGIFAYHLVTAWKTSCSATRNIQLQMYICSCA